MGESATSRVSRRDTAAAFRYPAVLMSEELAAWHDFNVGIVTASAALLGLLFVALSIHVRTLTAARNAELKSVARSIFLGYVVALGIGCLALMPQTLGALGIELLVLLVFAAVPFVFAARSGLRATGVGYDRRVTMVQFVAGFGLFIVTIAAAIGVGLHETNALYVVGGVQVLSLLWGVFNTWELIFRVQVLEEH
jgi:modulator of FtsH protease